MLHCICSRSAVLDHLWTFPVSFSSDLHAYICKPAGDPDEMKKSCRQTMTPPSQSRLQCPTISFINLPHCIACDCRSFTPSSLAHVRFTCLGLGDSNYTRFMAVSRAFRLRFADLGASTFYDSREADEVDGIEPVIEAWTAGMWGPLKAALSISPADQV